MVETVTDRQLLSLFCPSLFAGKTLLVTGGGTGIGFGTAHLFGTLGTHVVIAGRRPPFSVRPRGLTSPAPICPSTAAIRSSGRIHRRPFDVGVPREMT